MQCCCEWLHDCSLTQKRTYHMAPHQADAFAVCWQYLELCVTAVCGCFFASALAVEAVITATCSHMSDTPDKFVHT
jgi:hypothetical protein